MLSSSVRGKYLRKSYENIGCHTRTTKKHSHMKLGTTVIQFFICGWTFYRTAKTKCNSQTAWVEVWWNDRRAVYGFCAITYVDNRLNFVEPFVVAAFFYSLYGYAIEKCVWVCVERIINIHERRQLWTQKTNGRPTKKCVEKSFEFVFFFRKSTEWIKIAFLANIFSARRKFFTFVLALSPACPPQFHMMDKFHWAGFFFVRFDYFIIFLVHAVS